MKAQSNFMNRRQLKTVNRIGDILIPGTDQLPSFSELGGVEQIDRILAHTDPSDRKDLGLLLSVLSFFPGFLLRKFISFVHRAKNWATPIGDVCRQIMLGLRGIVFSLYYADCSGQDFKNMLPAQAIGFEVSVYTKDLESAESDQKKLSPQPR